MATAKRKPPTSVPAKKAGSRAGQGSYSGPMTKPSGYGHQKPNFSRKPGAR